MLNLIENKGPNNLSAVLRDRLRGSSTAQIGVAFVTEAGIDSLIAPLTRVAARGKVEILTGLYQSFIEPSVLRRLLKLQQQTKGRLSVHISVDRTFHKKLYTYGGGRGAGAVVGSQNLTAEGLRSAGELSVEIGLAGNANLLHRLAASFRKDWNEDSVPLSIDLISRYQKHRKGPPPGVSLSA